MNEMKMLEDLQKLIAYPSVSNPDGAKYPYGKATDDAKNYVLSLAREMGMRTTDVPGKYAYIEIGEGKELIGILSHLDVVPAGEGWSYDPFGGEIVGNRIYGRGTTDDKGPTIAVLYAMKELLDAEKTSHQKLHKRVRLILGQCEENGEWDDIKAYQEAEEIPSYGFTPDGDFPAIQCELGAMVFNVTMPLDQSGILYAKGGTAANMVPANAIVHTVLGEYTGEGVACHGCAPWLGTNAISKVMHQIALAELQDGGSRFAAIYDELIGETIYGEKLGIDCEDESGRLSFNVGKIETNEENVELVIDVRHPASIEAEGIIETIVENFRNRGCDCQCVYQVKPLYTPSDSPVLKALVDAYQEISGDDSKPISIGGGTYAKAMPNTVAFGPNFPGHENREHMEDEYILTSDFLMLKDIYVKAIDNLLQIPAGIL